MLNSEQNPEECPSLPQDELATKMPCPKDSFGEKQLLVKKIKSFAFKKI
jgi:hypothetical protein